MGFIVSVSVNRGGDINIIIYNVISFFKTLKVAKKPVAVLVQNERSMGTNLSQLNEKRKWAGKKRGG